jgi:hypothetical protein
MQALCYRGTAPGFGKDIKKHAGSSLSVERLESLEFLDKNRNRIRFVCDFRETRRRIFQAQTGNGVNDGLFTIKIVVEVAWTDVRFGANLSDRCSVKASARDTALGCVQDFGPLFLMLDRASQSEDEPDRRTYARRRDEIGAR